MKHHQGKNTLWTTSRERTPFEAHESPAGKEHPVKHQQGKNTLWSIIRERTPYEASSGKEHPVKHHQGKDTMWSISRERRPSWILHRWLSWMCIWLVMPGWHHSFLEIDHEIFSSVIFSLLLIQEGQLTVSGERMRTILVNRVED